MGKKSKENMATVYPTQGCCGSVTDRISLIRQVSISLRDGHHGIAALYDTIAKDVGPEERKQFEDKAAEHRRMGDESLKILLPDGVEDAEAQG